MILSLELGQQHPQCSSLTKIAFLKGWSNFAIEVENLSDLYIKFSFYDKLNKIIGRKKILKKQVLKQKARLEKRELNNLF